MSLSSDVVPMAGCRHELHNVFWYTEQCLLRLQNHLADAERDGENDGPIK
jgi:hypothetical protein